MAQAILTQLIETVWKTYFDNDLAEQVPTEEGKPILLRLHGEEVQDIIELSNSMESDAISHFEGDPETFGVALVFTADPSGTEATVGFHMVPRSLEEKVAPASPKVKKTPQPQPQAKIVATAPGTDLGDGTFESEFHVGHIGYLHTTQLPEVGDTVLVEQKSWVGFIPAWLTEIDGKSGVVTTGKRKLWSQRVSLKSIFKAVDQIDIPNL